MKNETLLFIFDEIIFCLLFYRRLFLFNFQKSATVEEGKRSSGIAIGFSTMQYSNETLYDGSSIEKSRFWPSWEFFNQYGITENFG